LVRLVLEEGDMNRKRFERVRGILAVGALAVGGCAPELDHPCTEEARYGLTVTVTRAGVRVCDAKVTAREGDFSETMSDLPGPACVYTGAVERAGTYAIEVVAGDRSKTVTGIKVTKDACHVSGQAVTIALDP
jgi:hypothetical protein